MTLYKNIKTNILNLFIGFLIIGATSVQAENAQYQSDSTLIAYLKEAGLTTTNGNEVFILKSGHEKFIDLFEKIRNARVTLVLFLLTVYLTDYRIGWFMLKNTSATLACLL